MFSNIPLCKEEEEEENLLFLINASQDCRISSFGGIFSLPLLILDLTLKNSPNFMNFKALSPTIF